MNRTIRLPVAVLIGVATCLMLADPVWAVSAGQVDDFRDGTEDWGSGSANPNPPVWVASGSPWGLGDGYLRVEGNGLDASGGNLIAFNTAQWAGDYIQAGVVAIRVDLRNLGETDLVIRLLVESASESFYTDAAVTLPAESGWRSAVIPLAADGIDIDASLAQVTKLRILHAPTPDGAVPVLGALGVDNVTALSGDVCFDAGFAGENLASCHDYCAVLDCTVDRHRTVCKRLARRLERRTARMPPCEFDADGDGVEDALDRCPDHPDPGQADLDGDGVGDACDNCPHTLSPEQADENSQYDSLTRPVRVPMEEISNL